MKKLIFSAFLLFIFHFSSVYAGELSLSYLPDFFLEYEGTGYRQIENGWEHKVKPRGEGFELRWRVPLTEKTSLQVDYLRNNPFFDFETGEARGGVPPPWVLTEMAVQALTVNFRRPLDQSSVDLLFGVQGLYETFDRRDFVPAATETPSVKEKMSAVGGQVGVGFRSARVMRPEKKAGFYGEGEFTIGHLLLTNNNASVEGGGIHKNGYSYHFRLELGVQKSSWRCGMSFIRRMYEVLVPGGQSLPGGATVSFPINKTDIISPAFSLTYVY